MIPIRIDMSRCTIGCDADRWERMEQEDRKIGRFEDGTEQVIGALIEVHRTFGPEHPISFRPSALPVPTISKVEGPAA